MKAVFCINPLADQRWSDFLGHQAHSSLFHSPEWLASLHSTYGYGPVAYTTSPPDAALENGWVFCEVKSWLTGRRLVSLPFSDHCDPLADDPADLEAIAHTIEQQRQARHWEYVQFRPQFQSLGNISGFELQRPFYLHKLDLRPTIDRLFDQLSRDSIQRKIRRAERDSIGYEEGRTESLIDRFYTLLCRTRQRHGVPPQPRTWFSNLFSFLRDRAIIRLASKNGQPVGALLTILYKHTLIYKYSCGEPQHFKHGTMQLLLWKAIQDAKARGIEELDFGRCDAGDDGLMLYKERWGALRSETGYFQSPPLGATRHRFFASFGETVSMTTFVPQAVVATAGRMLYRHFG